MIVVGVSGFIHAGKDEIAKFLVREYGFQIARFSDALKEEVIENFPILLKEAWEIYHSGTLSTLEGIRWMVFEEKPPLIRALLQNYGTEVRRKDDEDYWVKRWTRHVLALRDRQNGVTRVVAPDLRFSNEATAIYSMCGKCVRVSRPGYVGSAHKSEQPPNLPWDGEFRNIGTIADLEEQVETWLIHSLGLRRKKETEVMA